MKSIVLAATLMVTQAETTFFRALNHDPSLRKTAIRELTNVYAVDPSNPRAALLLGLAHLWSAAEGDRGNAATLDHLLLAEHHLERAQKLAPEDGRIPSWLVPTRLAIAGVERDPSTRDRLHAELMKAYEADPNFHSFTVALLGFRHARESAEFQRGLAALRTVGECEGDDPTCGNKTRWPHNREGFRIFRADYELKAGNVAAAKAQLEGTKQEKEYATFAYPEEVDDRLANLDKYAALYANADAGDDPPMIIGEGRSCQVCHRTK